MNYYIDLGSRKGVSLKWAMKKLKKIDKFIAIEPVPEFCEKLLYRYGAYNKFKLYNAAIGIKDGDSIFYLDKEESFIGKGSSLIEGMQNGEIIKVKEINLSNYIKSNFKKGDYLIVKIDIEGMEYDVLEDLIKTGAIGYIDKIFCEWHERQLVKKTSNNKEELIKRRTTIINDIERNGLIMQKGKFRFGDVFIREY